jgi:hypothetical protein
VGFQHGSGRAGLRYLTNDMAGKRQPSSRHTAVAPTARIPSVAPASGSTVSATLTAACDASFRGAVAAGPSRIRPACAMACRATRSGKLRNPGRAHLYNRRQAGRHHARLSRARPCGSIGTQSAWESFTGAGSAPTPTEARPAERLLLRLRWESRSLLSSLDARIPPQVQWGSGGGPLSEYGQPHALAARGTT